MGDRPEKYDHNLAATMPSDNGNDDSEPDELDDDPEWQKWVELCRISMEHYNRAESELEQYSTPWDTIKPRDVRGLVKALAGAKREEDMQQFLTTNPLLIVQHLGGGHGRYVIPKQKLGNTVCNGLYACRYELDGH